MNIKEELERLIDSCLCGDYYDGALQNISKEIITLLKDRLIIKRIEFEVLNGNSNVDDKNIEVFKKDKWINAYNQKPLECRSCLICNKYNGHIKIGYFQSDTWFDSNSDIATVTHWMKLPEEPV